LGWDWQGFRAFLDQCEFQVDRNDGRGFGPLTHSTVPGSVDNSHPLVGRCSKGGEHEWVS